jgi:transposase-like protein
VIASRGSYLRKLRAPRRPAELALLSVIQETYLAGASTRAVDALAELLGVPVTEPASIEVAARQWDERVEAFRRRPLQDRYPYLLLLEVPLLISGVLGATTCKAVVAVGRASSGVREVVGFALRSEGTIDFWTSFLGDLDQRGLHRLRLVTATPTDGLLAAVATVYPNAQWQHCRRDFLTHALSLVPEQGRSAVKASLRSVFCQPDVTEALHRLSRVRSQFEFGFPELVDALDQPVGARFAYFGVPAAQRRLVSSLSSLAPLERELRRACQLIGIFPRDATALRLVGSILQEVSDEWAARATARRGPVRAAMGSTVRAQEWPVLAAA